MSEKINSTLTAAENTNAEEINSSENAIRFRLPEIIDANRAELTALHAEEKAKRGNVVTLLQAEVKTVVDTHELENMLEQIDFAEDKFKFCIANSYAADVQTFAKNSENKGQAKFSAPFYPDKISSGAINEWGNPRDEAHYAHIPVEKVGIREAPTVKWSTEERLMPRKGLAGKLGFKKKIDVSVPVMDEPKYVFDYTFQAPSQGENETKRAGNYTGQSIQLSLELSKEQAESLSRILANNPKAARSILDSFMRATGDYGKWNAELYDDSGSFQDPGERYGQNFQARDVRPQYDAVPELAPQIVGLIAEQPAALR
ncbi:hypothetical protein FJZ39_01795 [Candidatus Saccharibacteria bacterium]|nr:hypothetical protein [Candidatus Saccharibacteria bacterium]